MKIRIHFSPVGYKNIGHLKYYWMNEQINQWINERKLTHDKHCLEVSCILINTGEHTQTGPERQSPDWLSLLAGKWLLLLLLVGTHHFLGSKDGKGWLLSHHVIGTSRGGEWVGGRTKYPVHRIQVTFSHWNKNIMWSGWERDWHSNFYVLRDKKSQLQTTDQSLVNKTNVIGPMTMSKNTYLTLIFTILIQFGEAF